MSTSPDLGVPFVASQQAQPEITHNEAILMLTATTKGAKEIGPNDPPVSPEPGDVYVVGITPTGAWLSRANSIAIYTDGGWRFVPDRDSSGTIIPMGARQEGMRVWDNASKTYYVWDGTLWAQTNVQLSGGNSGWADYADTTYTVGSPFSLAATTDTVLPNDGIGGNKTNEPPNFDFYDPGTSKILGNENHGRIVSIDMKVVPTNPATSTIDVWFDLNGLQLYRQTFSFPKGQGVVRSLVLPIPVYMLANWETFGAQVKVNSDNTCNIYDIRYIFHQLHPV